VERVANDPERLVPSSAAARALGVARETLWRWQQSGHVRPAYMTPGGQARWSIPSLRKQLGYTEEAPVPDSHSPEPAPVVAAIVTSDLGVLVGKRNDGKPPWTFIAGEIEPGESAADAAVREVKEETGLLVAAADFEIGRRVHPKTGRTMIYLPCSPRHGTKIFVGEPDELAEVRWISPDQADELLPGLFEPVRDHIRRVLTGS
jgi:8-oxo-dGTP pyrophosphatase MutT (NUDIX family)